MVKRVVAGVVAAAIVGVGCGGAGGPDGPDGADPLCEPRLQQGLAAWADAGFSGSIAIATGGRFDCLVAYGSADEAAGVVNTVDTVFSIGSITKAFTAAAVFDLVDDERLSLTDRAGDLVSGLDGPVADATVEQLLLHTSGLTGSHGHDHEPLERDAAIAAIGGLPQAFAPGTDYSYSNAGYTLLAIIIEEASGISYREHMASEILPLPNGDIAGGFWDGEPAARGPRAVGSLDDGPTEEMGDFAGPHWALEGNGALAMTAGDLAAWTHALLTGEIVAPASAAVIASPGFDHGDGSAETPGWVAFDDELLGESFLAAAGGGGDIGHNAVVVWLPESERVVVMASNTAALSAEELLQAAGPALVRGDPLPLPANSAEDVDPAELAAFTDTYVLDSGGRFDVTVGDDRLAIAATGTDAVAAVFPRPDGVTAEDVEGHEARVLALLNGETQAGREEVEVLESDMGPIDAVELAGTIHIDGELRTYVTVSAGQDSELLWYAVDDEGGVAAVEFTDDPPTLLAVPAGDGRFVPDDPTGSGPDVAVSFDDGQMTVAVPEGDVVARLAG